MSTMTLQRSRGSSEALLTDRFYSESRCERTLRPSPLLPPTSMEAEWPLTVSFGEGVFFFESKPDDWVVPILEQVCQLGSLPPNWNSYGGQPINPEIAATAVTLLLNVLQPNDPAPAIVPTSRGGILLEWHEEGIDLEVDIRSPSWIQVAFEKDNHEEEFDRADLEFIAEKLNLLRGRL